MLQGGWEDDETVEAAAQRETVEEAGVRGSIEVCGKVALLSQDTAAPAVCSSTATTGFAGCAAVVASVHSACVFCFVMV
jgi:8-oxo-dGTP pyrophosphatase MutT (NUDIX family)